MLVSITFKVSENSGEIPRKKQWCFTADVPTWRLTVATEATSPFETKPVTATTKTTTTAAWQANKNE